MSKKELVAANQESSVAIHQDLSAWGDTQVSSNDIVMPKILAMQGLSQFVMDGAAKFGDFCDSLSGEVLGSISKPIEFIPFLMDKVWIISKREGQKYQYSHTEPVTADTENLPWEDIDAEGKAIKREYVRAFYVLIPGRPIPYTLAFKGTSAKSGKILATQMYITNRMSNLSPAGVVMTLEGVKQQNDNGTYVVMSVKANRKTTPEEEGQALQWFKTISKQASRISSIREEVVQPEAPASNAAF
jgi:hypothetical protein